MKVDVSNEIKLKNQKGNPFGWSQSEIYHDGKRIGFVECGGIFLDAPGYSSEKRSEGPGLTRGIIYLERPEAQKGPAEDKGGGAVVESRGNDQSDTSTCQPTKPTTGVTLCREGRSGHERREE